MAKTDKTLLKFEFGAPAIERLEAIKSRLNIKNNAHTFGYALKLLEWFADQQFQGNKIYMENKDGQVSYLELELKP